MNFPAMNPELARYLREAHEAPRLSREEELILARNIKATGDRQAQDALTRAHLRDVVAIARKYQRYGLPLEELIAEGNFGLVQALGKFDPERGVRFVTYSAHWIRAYVLNHIINAWSLVGAGSGPLRSRVFFKLRRERTRITNLLGPGEEAERALAQRMGVSPETMQRMLQRLEARDVSLDAHVGEDAQVRWLDLLPSEEDQEETLFEHELGDNLQTTVRSALTVLDSRELYIAERRLMADQNEELSLAEIARTLGVSRERARQLEARAKRKLRTRIARQGNAIVHEWLTLRSAAPAA
ncbi:MAG TPA: sigma-70 family RNA polymerase sigma factor [Polyangiaceae bacterium]|nr:sigma-70 family RNA polymerase sigma factor [Polyangiaceae bacterium]